MSSVINQIFAPFGFHTASTVGVHNTTFYEDDSNRAKPMNILEGGSQHNIMVIAGYIPLIGSLVGFMRIMAGVGYVVLCHQDRVAAPEPALGYAMIARGVVELFSCGIALLAIDLIVSLGRYLSQCGAPSHADSIAY